MTFAVLVWEDGDDAIVYGPTNEKYAQRAYQAIEAAKGWDMNDPSSFATIVELVTVERLEDDFGLSTNDIWNFPIFGDETQDR